MNPGRSVACSELDMECCPLPPCQLRCCMRLACLPYLGAVNFPLGFRITAGLSGGGLVLSSAVPSRQREGGWVWG